MSALLLINAFVSQRLARLANPPSRPAGLGATRVPEGPRAVRPMAEFIHDLW
jgi:hypothetical protein